LKAIVEGSFPELKRIRSRQALRCSLPSLHRCNSDLRNSCELRTFLPKLLTNKGNQLTLIDLHFESCVSIDVVMKALKHCTAAVYVSFRWLVVDSPLTLTAEDVKAIGDLPNLQHFQFSILHIEEKGSVFELLRVLMETSVKDHPDFQFKYKYIEDSYWSEQTYLMCRNHW